MEVGQGPNVGCSAKEKKMVLWHVDPLLSNDREINNDTAAVAK
jgi:hypothetical protein